LSSQDRARSIGEVLEDLVEDFPDISVSKIRFLEAQGLISPARTPSGYRQFSESDVALLRWILALQREHYLPLKVIRKRLREGDGPGAASGDAAGAEPAAEAVAPVEPPAVPAAPAADTLPAAWYMEDDPGLEPLPTPVASRPVPPGPPVIGDLWSVAPPGRSWTATELAREVGLPEAAIAELSSFGLLPEDGGGLGEESLRAARAAAGFFRYGVEARHLRMYKTFAEREAALFEQVILPMASARQESGHRTREALAELAHLGQALRLSMLRAALGPPPGDH
jgi:DNA-binding transcriptional MerR regulator